MTEAAIPTHRDLQYPTLLAINELGGSASLAELDEKVVEIAKISDEQLAVEFPEESTASGPKVLYRIRWALTYLKLMGVVTNSERGVWSLTEQGNQILELSPANAKLWLQEADAKARAELREAKKAKSEPENDALSDESDEEVEGSWKEQLLDTLKDMDPLAFERLAMRLLREAGFTNVEVTVS